MNRTIAGITLTLLLVSMSVATIHIQPAKASRTIYIRADGSVEGTDKISNVNNVTYTFTDNIYDEIVVERSDITIDGADFTLQDLGSGGDFFLHGINNVTIKKTNMVDCGIYAWSSSGNNFSDNNFNRGYIFLWQFSNNNTVSANTITPGVSDGVALVDSSSYNNILRNTIRDGRANGIEISTLDSHHNTVSGNNVTNNDGHGIVISGSNNTISENTIINNYGGSGIRLGGSHNVLKNNTMAGNLYNFDVEMFTRRPSNDVDSSNTVEGKPIYYWVAQQNKEVPSDAGYVALVDSYNITVEGLELKNNAQGIALANTSKSLIINNNFTNNAMGVYLHQSSNNILSGNTINNSYAIGGCGIFLFLSFGNNTVLGNTISDNEVGIYSLFPQTVKDRIYHNNFFNNIWQVEGNYQNVWDDGYPSGGNYWSDYAGIDLYSGPYQNETTSDGIGDIPYLIGDRYPLMNPMGSPQPPIALFAYTPEQPVKDETVTFDASESGDRDGSITSYLWDFGDGNTTTTTDPIIAHTYTAQGTHTVNLTVTDNDGLNHSTTKSITVIIDTTPPTIGVPSREPAGDIQPDQPVKISVNVTDIVGQVKNVTLYYTLNNGTTWEQPLPMTLNSSTSLYEATIPGQPAGTCVKYKIIAYDQAGNNATLGETEPYFVYQVVPEFPSAIVFPLFMIFILVAFVLRKKRGMKK